MIYETLVNRSKAIIIKKLSTLGTDEVLEVEEFIESEFDGMTANQVIAYETAKQALICKDYVGLVDMVEEVKSIDRVARTPHPQQALHVLLLTILKEVKKLAQYRLIIIEKPNGLKEVDITFTETEFNLFKNELDVNDDYIVIPFLDEETLIQNYITTKNLITVENMEVL